MWPDGVDGTLLPKIWLERIAKYWNISIPTDFPKAEKGKETTFDNKLSSDDKEAVITLVSDLKSKDSPVLKAAPENTYVKDVVSTYNVTATEGDTKDILLSPNKVANNANIVALYKDGKDWKSATEVSIKDGYIYGTIGAEEKKDETSTDKEVTKAAPEKKDPITYIVAVFEVKKDIEEITSITSKDTTPLYACNGNPVTVLDGDNNTVILTNKNSGKQITLKERPSIFGGTMDGTDIESTSIYVKAKNDPKIIIYAGSSWNGDKPVYSNNSKVVVEDSIIHSVTGADGKVRTNNLSITISNSTINNAIGADNSLSLIYGLDVNADIVKKTTPEYYKKLGLGANSWTKKSVITLNNVTDPYIISTGTASGYSYTEDATLNINGGKYGYIIAGGSNGSTAKSTVNISNVEANVVQIANKGLVGSANLTISDSKIAMLFADGDETNKSATGTTDGPVNIEINAPKTVGSDSYFIYAGTDGGIQLTKEKADSIINKIKISRSANYTIADDSKEVLADKIVIK